MSQHVRGDGPARRSARRPAPLLIAGLLLIALGPAGCVGPRGLELTRLRYDQAVHETTEQQWLRNLVRLRYGEVPTFLDVAAINSQLELSSRGSITGGRQRDSPNETLFGDLAVQFRDAPTLSYTPRSPTELTRASVAPVGITAIGLMANTGWSGQDVLRLMVSEANGLANAPGAEMLVPAGPPLASPFEEVARLIDSIRASGAGALISVEETHDVSPPISEGRVVGADLVAAAGDGLQFRPTDGPSRLVLSKNEPGYALAIVPRAADDPEVEAFRKLLRLTPGRLEYRVRRVERRTVDPLRPLLDDQEDVALRTRTILEMMIFLSKGVVVPEEHACKGIAVQTPGPDGLPFDWTSVTRGLFRVCVARKKPKGAAVAVEYRGYWFFIDQSDHRSKSTLALIQALLNIQLTEPDRPTPLLTLPVGL